MDIQSTLPVNIRQTCVMPRKRKQTLTVREGLDLEVSSIDSYSSHMDTSLQFFDDEIYKDINLLNFNDVPEMLNETGINKSYNSLTDSSFSNNAKDVTSLLDICSVPVSSGLDLSTSEFCLEQFNISGDPVERITENIENITNYACPPTNTSGNVKSLSTSSWTADILSKATTPGSGFQNFQIFDGTMSQCCEADVKVENWLSNQPDVKEEVLEGKKFNTEPSRVIIQSHKVVTPQIWHKDVLSENQEINRVKSPLTRKFLKLGEAAQDGGVKRIRRDSCSQRSITSGTDMSETLSNIEIANKTPSNMNSSMCSGKSEVSVRLKLSCETQLDEEGTFVCTLRNVLLDQSLMIPEEFKDNDDKIKYYTGIPTFKNFVALLVCMRLHVKHDLLPFQILLLTCMKLRHNTDWEDLGYRFNISPSLVETVFYSTLTLMADCFSGLMQWSDHLMVMNKPVAVQNRKSTSIYFHSITSCTSKNNVKPRLYKTLLAISSSSAGRSQPSVVFISKPYEGTETDMQLIARNRIFGIMILNDVIMFDKVASCPEGLTFRVEKIVESTTGWPKNAHFSQIKPTVRENEFRSKAENVISCLKCYKMLDTIPDSWLHMGNVQSMMEMVIKVIAGIANLCKDRPFDSKLLGIITRNRNRIHLEQ